MKIIDEKEITQAPNAKKAMLSIRGKKKIQLNSNFSACRKAIKDGCKI